MIRTALAFVTGGSVTRLTATLLLGVALGAWGGWQVQGWRHGVLRARAAEQQARDTLRQVNNRDRASAAHQVEQSNADTQHIKLVERVRIINTRPGAAVQCLDADGLRELGAAIGNGAPTAAGPGAALPATDPAS